MSLPLGISGQVLALAGDALGKPTGDAFDGPLSFSVDQPLLASLQVAADGFSAILTSLAIGTVVVSASGLVGGRTISGSLSVDITDVATQILLSLKLPS